MGCTWGADGITGRAESKAEDWGNMISRFEILVSQLRNFQVVNSLLRNKLK